MTRDRFDAEGLLHSEAPLTNSFVPEEPIGRDVELGEIIESLQPLAHRRPAENLFMHGPTGVGKSICVNHAFEYLENVHSVNTIHINCWQYNTRSSLLAELLIKMGYPAPRKGKPVDELLSRMGEWLDKNQSIAVALDEFDQLHEQNEIVYDLYHLSESAENHFGLVLVSNQHPENIEFDPRCESRLSCQTLEFLPYSERELAEILEDRAERAFRKNVVEDDVIQAIAEKVARQSGDCRKALRMLMSAGRFADREKADRVTPGHVERVE